MEVNGMDIHSALKRCSQRQERTGAEEVNFSGNGKWLSSDINNYSGRQARKLLKDKTDGLQMIVDAESAELNQVELSRKKKIAKYGREIETPENNEVSYPAKRSKSSVKRSISLVSAKVATKISLQTNTKVESKGLSRHGEVAGNAFFESTASKDKWDNHFACGVKVTATDSLPGNEDVLRPTEYCRQAVDSSVTNQLGKRLAALKNGRLSCPDEVKSLTVPTKRRVVRLCEDEEEEPPKTPVHGGAEKVSISPRVLCASKKTNVLGGSLVPAPIMKDAGMLEDGAGRELAVATERTVEDASLGSQQDSVQRPRKTGIALVPCSPMKLVSDKLSSKDGKPPLPSPKKAAASVAATKPMFVMEKLSKHSIKKAQNVSDQIDVVAERSYTPLNKPTNGRSNQTSSTELNKATSTSNLQDEDSVLASGNPSGGSFLPGERPVVGREDKTSSSVDSKISHPVMSMKHLIAAAQAKRRQAHSQNFSSNSVFVVAPNAGATRSSPSPASPVQPLGSNSTLRLVAQGFQSPLSLVSPSSDVCQLSATCQPNSEQFEEKRINSGHSTTVVSLSLGTEVAVARDAFEGMVETLSRTRESIGRATRLAIDCAKYGISNEVMELLIRKLESEPSCLRKVDLFFLVDSITQCSHNYKGIASASYLPTVQAALPRLLAAAAPAGAHENRCQCLKVLRLWLERKIFPESLLRHYMDGIEVANDDTSSGFSLRLPSRAERAVDDPIREIYGMLVDEYGSNATFQLPGLLSSHAFEDDDDEEDMPSSNKVAERSPAEHATVSRDLENHSVTPNERRHCILEDVDGELEMEDVSGHLKDERWPYADSTFEGSSSYSGPEENLGSALSNSDLPPLREGSPPLPPGSPPPTPPLPSSPPPPLPPCSPFSPPPPPPPSQSHPFLVPPVDSPSRLLRQQTLPPQPSTAPQCLALLPASTPPSPSVAYWQHPAPHKMAVANGNQLVRVVGYAPHGSHSDVADRSDLYPQESPCFIPFRVGNSHEPTGYGQLDVCINTQPSQSDQQFQAINLPCAQRPMHPNPSPQDPANHFSYLEPSIPQHLQQPYPKLFPLRNLHDAPQQIIANEQWRALPVEFENDRHSSWMAGERSCPGAPFGKEGFFRPLPERASTGAFGFQSPEPNALPAGFSVPGCGMSRKADTHTLSWRPV